MFPLQYARNGFLVSLSQTLGAAFLSMGCAQGAYFPEDMMRRDSGPSDARVRLDSAQDATANLDAALDSITIDARSDQVVARPVVDASGDVRLDVATDREMVRDAVSDVTVDTGPPPVTYCLNRCEYARDGECDDGALSSDTDVCLFGTDCNDCGSRTGPANCGDRTLDSDEGCDDGNRINGDGCSRNCAVESGWLCERAWTPPSGLGTGSGAATTAHASYEVSTVSQSTGYQPTYFTNNATCGDHYLAFLPDWISSGANGCSGAGKSGVVWFRSHFDVNAADMAQSLINLRLRGDDEIYRVFLNGELIYTVEQPARSGWHPLAERVTVLGSELVLGSNELVVEVWETRAAISGNNTALSVRVEAPSRCTRM